ncbi:pilus assembly protein TadG-related protein [Mesorhizobium sp. WSM2239]|uniref:Pilus assembly protein TadG-related protein n=2 Tax=unclassified Mesorhizobium TaxID=325217 RepID=A0AAU8D4F9_9HYPH
MMMVVTLPATLGAAGLAIDVTNLLTARTNLQNALDSAVLAASRLMDGSKSRQEAFDGFFAANIYGRNGLENAEADLSVEEGVNYIKTSATAHADVNLHFAFLFGKSARVTAEASAYESTANLEVALVLDNTGSMGATNMKALREAATDLIETLQAEQKAKPDREIRAALVPFVTAVNIKTPGENYMSWIDTRTNLPENDPGLNGKNFEPNEQGKRVGHWLLFNKLHAIIPEVEWKGCVEARLARFNADGTPKLGDSPNLDDTPPDPSKPETLFVPYFAPDEPGKARAAINSSNELNNTYLDDTDVPNNADARTIQKSLAKYSVKGIANVISEKAPTTSGPNYACATPIAPLTKDLTALKTEIGKMVYWYGSGTNVSEGLAWGLRVLSPGKPYTQGNPFDAKETTKVVVVFTDGENNVFGAANASINKSDYGSYNFLDTGRMGTTDRSKALDNVNKMTLGACNLLKDKDVRIFTVVLGADSKKNRDLYSTCATSPADYYPTKNPAELKAAFQQISYSISQLSVTN